MLKIFDVSANQLTIYYNYIKDLNKLYSILSHKNPQYDDILSIIQKIEKYNSELNKDYIDSINIRINLIESESIYIIQSNFFSYLSQNFFFDTEEDRKEEFKKS